MTRHACKINPAAPRHVRRALAAGALTVDPDAELLITPVIDLGADE